MSRYHALLIACAALTLGRGAHSRSADGSAASSEPDPEPLGPPVPDFAKLQSGGYSGTVTVGLGYAAFHDRLNLAFLYGYVPPNPGRGVHSLHVILSLRPYEFRNGALRWVPLYPGLGALCTSGPDYFFIVPMRYPLDYYPPTAVRFTALVGTELDWVTNSGFFEGHGVYWELTTLDSFVAAYVRNPRVVELTDIVSSSIGYRAEF